MLNINQNFDLKAPVFNFDRDYFNSVEELNAYDTSNVPDHFVTNVAGMLYQFTEGAWVPMISASYCDTEDSGYHGCILGLIDDNCFISKNYDSNKYYFNLGADDSYVTIDNSSSIEMKSTSSDYPTIHINQEIGELYKRMWIGNSWDTGFGLNIEHQKYLDSVLQYSKYIKMFVDKELTQEEQDNRYSQVDMSLTDGDYSADINAKHGFMHKTEDGFTSYLDGEALNMRSQVGKSGINSQGLSVYDENNKQVICLQSFEENSLTLGSDEKFKISRQLDNTEGAVISGIKSLTAFANPSATKVWATDGSTVDLTTKADASALDAKANASDVLLKKSASGGYYIESNSNELGWGAFAANIQCTASGSSSFAEGSYTKALGYCSHAEGYYTTADDSSSHAEGYHTQASGSYSHAEGASTKAIGTGSHVEGNDTKAQGNYAHAEGENTKALGNYSHAEGQGTSASDDSSHAEGNGTDAQNCSHAEGNYTHAVGMYTHAEGEYTSASGSCSHAEGFATYSNGTASHSEGNNTKASGYCSHAQGTCNVDYKNAIHSVGIGNSTTRKNAEYIYAKSTENGTGLMDDPKNGYKYLIGVGGYDGISTDNSTYKSVQEVIADLTARIEQLEKLTANCVSISNVDEQTN